jgi:hypothetical protein
MTQLQDLEPTLPSTKPGRSKIQVLPKFRSGLPDFSSYSIPKRGKCTKLPENLPNRHEKYQMVVKYSKWPQNIPNMSIQRSSKIYSNRNFWFEKMLSGKPASDGSE